MTHGVSGADEAPRGVGRKGERRGVAISLVATIQMIVALNLEHGYDRSIFRALVFGALYPVAYWLIPATAALHSEVVALVRGPSDRPVVWNIPASTWTGRSPPRRISASGRQTAKHVCPEQELVEIAHASQA